MALIKCGECGKQISSNANACPACGNPIGRGGSEAVSILERRIEEYKKNRYVVYKQSDNSVTMVYNGITPKLLIVILIGGSLLSFGLVRILFFTSPIVIDLFLIILGLFIAIIGGLGFRVYITLTKAGKIEETGFTLNKAKKK